MSHRSAQLFGRHNKPAGRPPSLRFRAGACKCPTQSVALRNDLPYGAPLFAASAPLFTGAQYQSLFPSLSRKLPT